jgi:hypothetical protein
VEEKRAQRLDKQKTCSVRRGRGSDGTVSEGEGVTSWREIVTARELISWGVARTELLVHQLI